MALDAGVISVTIDYAKDIRNMEWFGKQDPYCILCVGGQTFRTRTAKDGGRNPVWNETFRISLVNENDVSIDIKDEDLGRDDFIGNATFSLARARQTGHDRLEAPVFGAKSRKQHGFVSITLKWTPHRPPAAHPPHPQWSAVQYGVPQPQPGGAPAVYMPPPGAVCYQPYSPYMVGPVLPPPGAHQPVVTPPTGYQQPTGMSAF